MIAGQFYKEHGGYYAGGNIKVGKKTYAIIIAPKEQGETSLPWKSVRTPTIGADSTYDGKANMKAIKEHGFQYHPAAKFCHDLRINGFRDWHLPSPDELEICYRFLKPTSYPNYTTRRPPLSVVNGTNYNGVPVCDGYTFEIPTETESEDFAIGGSQAFETDNFYWTSMNHGAHNSCFVFFLSGNQYHNQKTMVRFVRAVRWVYVG